ncbi:MAG: ATP-binding cassette domain-containing protein, partial [Polyangia bacterium]
MISTRNLGKEYGARTLFAGVNLELNAGARYGLVGANGSGKTTFLRIVAGDEGASAGSVGLPKRARVGVLRQDRFLEDDALILDLAMRGDAVVWSALDEQRRLGQSPSPHGANDDQEGLAASVAAGRMGDLEDVIAAHDGYTLEARTSEVLEGLGIPTAVHRLPLSTLSGGFKLRVLLAQVLMGGADVLLLDEPTNHLDILTIRWLEKFLARYAGCAVVISHDQRFLDNVTTHTLDVDYGTITA